MMLHRGIKFVHAAVLAYSAVLAFLFLRSLEEDWVLGHSAVVWVTDSDNSASGSQVARGVAVFAQEQKATVAREVLDLKDPSSRRHLYLAPGGPRSSWLEDGYPTFNRDYHTDIHAVTDLGLRDPRGFYYVFGSDQAATSLTRTFTDLGLTAKIYHPFSVAQLTSDYGGSALYRSFFVVALAVVTMTGAGVLLNAKAYGVLRLQGKSFGQILRRDLRQLAAFWSIAFAAVAGTTLLLLGLYNRLAWIGTFTLLTLGATLVLGLVALATHAAMLGLLSRTDVLSALKGELPARAAAVCAYLVRIPALLLALSIASAVVLAGQDVLARQESSQAYAKAGTTASIAFNGSLASEAGLHALEKNVRPWLREADKDGQIIFAGHRRIRGPGLEELMKRDVLIVNDSFLAAQPVRDSSGRRHTARATDPEQVRLLIPRGLAGYAGPLREQVPGLLNPVNPDVVEAASIQTVWSKDSQRVFTYNPSGQRRDGANPGADDSLVTDPVIIAFPNGSPLVSDKLYTNYASQSSVVFPDPDDVTAGIKKHHLETYVMSVTPVAQNAADMLRDLVGDFRLQLFNLAVAVAVLLITGVGVCIVHSRKNAQSIFARHISGWTFTTTHRPVLLLEGLLAVLLAVWLPFQVWQQNQDLARYEALGIPAPRPATEITGLDLGVTFALVAVEVAAVLLALAAFHRRIVKEGATQS
ncbi:bacteriocin-associated integral membrane family protein [Streptomyces sp. NPDC001292]|uniref:bacteriocin-associated integral membrane family protein n=1 Tax=Streptomyces sp. NPDC001292 TaxID=3364558 RepID=UPI003680CADB